MEFYNGDCLEVMKTFSDNSIDMVITSPPYAEQRKSDYGGIKSDEYVEWFATIGKEIKRILKPTGSFFLNIKPHTTNGERDLYVFELIIMIKRELGFKFVDEFAWVKQAYPGRYHGRFKNGFEPVYHFVKGEVRDIIFNPLACSTPVKYETVKRGLRKNVGQSSSGSGMIIRNKNFANIVESRPSNVIQVNNISNQFSGKSKHSATYPVKLVDFFVKSFSNENDVVLDPFMGSGTTGISCKNLNRNFIGIEIDKSYFELAKKRIDTESLLYYDEKKGKLF